MHFDPIKQVIQITPEEARRFTLLARAAMRQVRLLSKLPLHPHARRGRVEPADLAQSHIVDAAACLGVDLGGVSPESIDLQEET